MKRYILVLSIFIVPFVFFATSCGDDDDSSSNVCDTSDVTYTNSIATILDSNCAVSGCHTSGAAYIGPMGNYAEAAAFAGATMVGAVNHNVGFEPMPQSAAKLSDCNIAKIEAWIDAGAPE